MLFMVFYFLMDCLFGKSAHEIAMDEEIFRYESEQIDDYIRKTYGNDALGPKK